MNPQEIVNNGKRVVEDQLKNIGWSQIMTGEQVPPPIDVIAAHKGKKLLISISPTIQPKEPENLDPQQESQLKSMAMQNNADPYQVKVQLTPDMTRVNKVLWRKLV
ncbi:MAG: hypothetical protein ACMUHU_01410 [Thermoplasmatota archaeon]